MLRGADLDKILDDDYGDAGYNDEVSMEPEPPEKKVGASGGPGALPAPFERRPVLGAAPPPPPGIDSTTAEMNQAIDEAARERGYKDAHEYNAYLEKKAAPKKEEEDAMQQQMMEPDLAPGIKKAPAYMPPGAYPGDRTKVNKDYAERTKYRDEAGAAKPVATSKPGADAVETKYIKQQAGSWNRPEVGNIITFRTAEGGPEQDQLIGGPDIPWALDVAARKMKVGDIVEVVAHGEHAFADCEAVVPDTERRWPFFELISIGGKPKGKFQLSTLERLELADELRLRGNHMFKGGRNLRAMDYYERGSALMDVLEADSLGMPGMPVNKEAEMKNKCIWACQRPLLLNWALILMKFERWEDAERKCTEVLMDIDKLDVKALFRRGRCNVHLGKQEQARTDLERAAELDTSLRREVDRELLKVDEMQRLVDRKHAPLAKKVVKDIACATDARSTAPPAGGLAEPALTPNDRLILELRSHEAASVKDREAYCRQREAIYNRFIPRVPVEDD